MKGWRRKSATGVLAKVVEVTADMERAERGGDGGGDGDDDGRRRPQRWGGGGLTMVEARAGGHWRQSACPRIVYSHIQVTPTLPADDHTAADVSESVSESVSENGVHKGLGVVGFGDTHTPHTHSVKRTVSNPQLLRGVRRRRTITLLPIDLAPL